MKRGPEVAIYAITVTLSLLGHVGVIKGLGTLAQNAPQRARTLEISVVKSPEPKPPPVEVTKPPPEKKSVDLTKIVAPLPEIIPAPNSTEVSTPSPEPARPTFGISMSSVNASGSGSGFSVRVGNTLMKEPEKEFTPPEQVRTYAPVPLYQVSKIPKVRGICKASYPKAAKDQGITGKVQLEVDIKEDGAIGTVRVLSGLGHGLDEAAVEGIRGCTFEPAEQNGKAVATRIVYTFTFIIED